MIKLNYKSIIFSILALFIANQSFADDSYLAPEKEIVIGQGYNFTYKFAQKPKIGETVMKVTVSDKTGAKVKGLEVTADYDMPVMKGMHGVSGQKFFENNGGDYLLPVNLVMPGEWIIDIYVKDQGVEIYRGKVQVNL